MDADVRDFVTAMAAVGPWPAPGTSLDEARAQASEFARAGPREPVASVRDLTADGVPVRVYAPADDGERRGALVFFHGGGWIVGDLDHADHTCRQLANAIGCVVVSVEYRLAPEHPYPAALDDCMAATRWAIAHPDDLGIDPGRVAVGGLSAGGNLAAAVALVAREEGDPVLCAQLLIVPLLDDTMSTPSHRDDPAVAAGVPAHDHRQYWDRYVADPAARQHPRVAPSRAESLAELPPAVVLTAELDPLRDEGEAYAARLRRDGVSVAGRCVPGAIHLAFGMAARLGVGRRMLDEAAAALRPLLAAASLVAR